MKKSTVAALVLWLVVVPVVLLVAGCATAQLDQNGQPIDARTEVKVLDPDFVDTVKTGKEIWCGNLHNLRRIVLRMIRAIDPQWTSICEVPNEQSDR